MLRTVVSALVCVSLVQTQDFYRNNFPARLRPATSQGGKQYGHNPDERPWQQRADPEERGRVGHGPWGYRDESSREELDNEYWDEDSVSDRSNSYGQTTRVSELETTRPSTAETTRPSTAETTRPSTAKTTRPSTAETTRPSTAETTRPSTAESTKPSTVVTERTTPVEKKCANGYTQSGNGCYRLFLGNPPWANAEGCCVKYGDHLASVHSAEENAFLRSFGASYGALPAYIGARVTRSGLDHWPDGSPTNYTNWAPGQPDNSIASVWHGLMNVDGTWKALDGTIVQPEIRGFLCKWNGTL